MREKLLEKQKKLKEKYSKLKENRLSLITAADEIFNEMLKLEGAFTVIDELLTETKPCKQKPTLKQN